MPNLKAKDKVHLTGEQRKALEAICRRQSVAAAKVRRARILLMAAENHLEGRRPDWQIAEAVGLCERQVVHRVARPVGRVASRQENSHSALIRNRLVPASRESNIFLNGWAGRR